MKVRKKRDPFFCLTLRPRGIEKDEKPFESGHTLQSASFPKSLIEALIRPSVASLFLLSALIT